MTGPCVVGIHLIDRWEANHRQVKELSGKILR
jgi:hypothetical protein